MILIQRFVYVVFITALLSATSAFAKEQAMNTHAVKAAAVGNLVIHENQILSAAQPTQEQLKKLANAGVKHVI
ncbi:MAG: hypothetical protein ACTH56_09885, partial [Pseudoalteromonas sp.]